MKVHEISLLKPFLPADYVWVNKSKFFLVAEKK